MKTEIYQRYLTKRIIKTKANKLLEVTIPKGVFVARVTNKGQIRVSMSLLHKNDRFNLKDGLNAARKNADKLDTQVYITTHHKAAFDKFVERAKRYFKSIDVNEPVDVNKPVDDWTGKFVHSKSHGNRVWYYVVKDNGNTIECQHAGWESPFIPNGTAHVYTDVLKINMYKDAND